MQFKGTDDKFVVDGTDPTKFQTRENYLFVHPNFDRWEDHLTRFVVQVNTQKIVMVTRRPDCGKAAYTHEFFNLHEFEVDSFDAAQSKITQRRARQ